MTIHFIVLNNNKKIGKYFKFFGQLISVVQTCHCKPCKKIKKHNRQLADICFPDFITSELKWSKTVQVEQQ